MVFDMHGNPVSVRDVCSCEACCPDPEERGLRNARDAHFLALHESARKITRELSTYPSVEKALFAAASEGFTLGHRSRGPHKVVPMEPLPDKDGGT